jgi:hypothetical protein
MPISNQLKSKKIKAKKLYQRKCYVKMEFFYFYLCVQKFSAYNFIWVNIFRSFHDIHLEFVKSNFFLLILTQNGSEKEKPILYVCLRIPICIYFF